MIEPDDVRRIACSLPEVEDRSDASTLRFLVGGKQFAWSWQERIEADKARRSRLDVLVVRCPEAEKHALLESDPARLFTEDHYRGFPAVLVRLEGIGEAELGGLLVMAWRCQAPRALARTLQA